MNVGILAPSPLDTNLADLFAGIYAKLQYGSIPKLENAPSPAAPKTTEQLTIPGAWTTDDSILGSDAAWQANYAAQVQTAENSGDYVPGGRLPIDASGNLNFSASSLSGWLIVGGLIVAGYVVFKVLR